MTKLCPPKMCIVSLNSRLRKVWMGKKQNKINPTTKQICVRNCGDGKKTYVRNDHYFRWSPFSNIALAYLCSVERDSVLSCSHQQLGAVAAGMQRTGSRFSLAGWLGLLEHSRRIFPLCKCRRALHLRSQFLSQILPSGACIFRSYVLKREQCLSIWEKKLA